MERGTETSPSIQKELQKAREGIKREPKPKKKIKEINQKTGRKKVSKLRRKTVGIKGR